jgi:hypothetical protein
MPLLEPMQRTLEGGTRDYARPGRPANPLREAPHAPSAWDWPAEAPEASRLGHGLAWGLGLGAAFWLMLAAVLVRIFG